MSDLLIEVASAKTGLDAFDIISSLLLADNNNLSNEQIEAFNEKIKSIIVNAISKFRKSTNNPRKQYQDKVFSAIRALEIYKDFDIPKDIKWNEQAKLNPNYSKSEADKRIAELLALSDFISKEIKEKYIIVDTIPPPFNVNQYSNIHEIPFNIFKEFYVVVTEKIVGRGIGYTIREATIKPKYKNFDFQPVNIRLKPSTGFYNTEYKNPIDVIKEIHRKEVSNAIDSGLFVPNDVLIDYPDLENNNEY